MIPYFVFTYNMESNETATSNGQQPKPTLSTNGSSGPRDSKGWDGKLRVDKKAVLANPEALSDPDYSDEDAPPVEQIDADEGQEGVPLVLGSH